MSGFYGQDFWDPFCLTFVGQCQFQRSFSLLVEPMWFLSGVVVGARCSGDSGARMAHLVSFFLVFLSCFLASSVSENYRFGDPSMFVGLISRGNSRVLKGTYRDCRHLHRACQFYFSPSYGFGG